MYFSQRQHRTPIVQATALDSILWELADATVRMPRRNTTQRSEAARDSVLDMRFVVMLI